MKLTPETIAGIKELADHLDKSNPTTAGIFRDLIADLEDATAARGNGVLVPAPKLEEMQAELVATRKQLAEAQARNAQVLSIAEKMRCAGGAHGFQYWFDELKLFLLRKPDTSALDAAIAEAINDEKRNPWKQAIIEGLIVNHILHTDHETDPVKALTALVDWECKTALDPAVSKEAQELIEPYRKDAACWQFVRKNLLWREAGPASIRWSMELAMPAPNIGADWLTEDSVSKCLDAAVLAAIAAKGDSK